MATIAQMKTYIDTAVTSMGTGAWDDAITALLQAKAIKNVVPDVDIGGAKTLWRDMQGDDLIDQCRRQSAQASSASRGFQVTSYRSKRIGAG